MSEVAEAIYGSFAMVLLIAGGFALELADSWPLFVLSSLYAVILACFADSHRKAARTRRQAEGAGE